MTKAMKVLESGELTQSWAMSFHSLIYVAVTTILDGDNLKKQGFVFGAQIHGF